MNNVRELDIAIDIVKFLAVFLIINSHADIMYPHLRILATGGAVVCNLDLFVHCEMCGKMVCTNFSN